jgi:hypothetical protein
MEDCAPSTFLKSWALVASYLCSRFNIFDKFVMEEYVSQVEGHPHLLQSWLCAVQNGLLPTSREMHLFFESLAITNASCL